MNKKKLALIAVLLFLASLFFLTGLNEKLSLSYIQEQKNLFLEYKKDHLLLTITGFVFLYIVTTALSLPGAALLTLLSGALFGVFIGTILASFASTTGSTLAFLSSRFLFQDSVRERFPNAYNKINKGVEKEGAFYLFSLRLIPLFPFFVINLLMGLTRIKTSTFYGVSALGMLPGTVAYVNAGTQISEIDSLSEILSLDLILSFVIVGILPIISKKIVNFVRKRKKTYA